MADFTFRYDSIDTCRSPFIVFECRNDNDEKVFYSAEKAEDIIKYPEQGKWYDVKISRIINTRHAKEIEYIVYFLNSNAEGKYQYSIKNTSIVLKGFP